MCTVTPTVFERMALICNCILSAHDMAAGRSGKCSVVALVVLTYTRHDDTHAAKLLEPQQRSQCINLTETSSTLDCLAYLSCIMCYSAQCI